MAEVRVDVPRDNPDVEHEESDINVRMVLWIAAAFVVTAAILHFAVAGLFQLFKSQESSKPQETMTLVRKAGRPLPNGPLLQPFPFKESGAPESPLVHTPVTDMEALRLQQRSFLDSYGWVDRQQGLVRMPIDRAKHLFVVRESARGGGLVASPPVSEGAGSIPAAGTSTSPQVGEPPARLATPPPAGVQR